MSVIADSREPSAERRPGIFLMANTLERGGTERQFVTLAGALKEGVFEVGLGCLARRGEFLENVPDILEFSPAGSLFKLRSFRTRAALARHLHKQKILVAHAFDFYANLMLIPAAGLARVPAVIGSHRQLGDLQTPMQFRVQNMMFRLCDRVVCNSRAAAARLCEGGLSAGKTVVIPNALPDDAFVDVPPMLPVSPETIRIGMIARMNHPLKNHRIFLRVAARLAERFRHVEFVLVGDGPLRRELEAFAAQLGLGNRVRFLGDQPRMSAVLASLHVTMLPSSSESLSNAILESMAAGVPVVATNVGGNPELIQDGETGFLVSLADDAFVEALKRLLADPELRRTYGQRARLHVSRHHRIDAIRHSYEQLYQSLLGEKNLPIELGTVKSFV
jgi:glycosyltransferase involved in cell wall biosynthesis